ncbi:unnamed protein product [Urochloa humidicola]
MPAGILISHTDSAASTSATIAYSAEEDGDNGAATAACERPPAPNSAPRHRRGVLPPHRFVPPRRRRQGQVAAATSASSQGCGHTYPNLIRLERWRGTGCRSVSTPGGRFATTHSPSSLCPPQPPAADHRLDAASRRPERHLHRSMTTDEWRAILTSGRMVK